MLADQRDLGFAWAEQRDRLALRDPIVDITRGCRRTLRAQPDRRRGRDQLHRHQVQGDPQRKDKIEDAFRRSADLDARRIGVDAYDGKVTLSGTVSSWSERDEAPSAAWAAPGVTSVEDDLTIAP